MCEAPFMHKLIKSALQGNRETELEEIYLFQTYSQFKYDNRYIFVTICLKWR